MVLPIQQLKKSKNIDERIEMRELAYLNRKEDRMKVIKNYHDKESTFKPKIINKKGV
jgi:hypothetical protein